MMIRIAFLASVSALSMSIQASSAFAQTEDNPFIDDEIIVTATKRETALTDTSIAITAITNDTRDRLGIEGVQDVADITPGMTVQDTPNRISIRGVGRLTNALGSDPGVGIYLDGIYTSETASIGASTLVNERIEVLRGPQGTLYGRNTVGGAVNTISIRPTDEWEGHVRARLGNYDKVMMGGSVSGPIAENIRVRLVGSVDERDGYIKNLGAGGDQWAQDEYYLEGQVEMDLTDDFQIWMKYSTFSYDTTPREVTNISPFDTETFRGSLVVNPVFDSGEVNPAVQDPFEVAYDYTGFLKLDNNHSLTGHIDWDLGDVSVKYMGGWNKYDYTTSFDADGSNRTEPVIFPDPNTGAPISVPTSYINDIGESKEWSSHDFQILSNKDTGAEWIVGAYYYEEDIFQPFNLRAPGNIYLANPRIFTEEPPSAANFGLGFRWDPAEPNPDSSYYYQDGTLKSKAYALYGQAGFNLSDQISLTGGLRYSKDEKTGSETQRIVFDRLETSFDPAILLGIIGGTIPPTTPFWADYSVDVTEGILTDTHSQTWNAMTGMVSAEYRPNDDTLWYVTASQGYKSGGFRLGGISDIAGTANVNEAEVDEERILAFELGNKTSFGDNFQLNSAVYYYEYEDLQAEVDVRRSGINLTELFNAADSRVFGFETEANWQAGDNTQIIASYAFSDSEYKDFCGDRITANPDGSMGCLVDPLAAPGDTNLVDPTGNRLNKAPKHKFAAIANHSIPMEAGRLSFSGTYAYVGAQYYSVFNHPENRVGGYDRVDSRVSWYDNDDKFQFHVFVRNAFDNDAATTSGSSGEPYFYISRAHNAPRTYGAELQVNF